MVKAPLRALPRREGQRNAVHSIGPTLDDTKMALTPRAADIGSNAEEPTVASRENTP